MSIKIPVYKPSINGNEKKYVNECLESSQISSKGKFLNKFELEFSKYLGVKYSSSVSNGTVAIHLALKALDLGQGDEIIVPSFTYISSVNAIDYVGANPVFVDSREDTWNLDVNEVEKKFHKRLRLFQLFIFMGQHVIWISY